MSGLFLLFCFLDNSPEEAVEAQNAVNSMVQQHLTLENVIQLPATTTPAASSSSSSRAPRKTGLAAVAAATAAARTPLDEDADPTQAWFTTKDDKQTLTHRGHSWKQGQWSKDEVELLQSNIGNYCVVSTGSSQKKPDNIIKRKR